MRLSIRAKFLIVCLLLVFSAIVGISATYYTLTRRDKQRESRQRIQIGFDIILNDFSKRVNAYTESARKFLAENVTLLWATYTYSRDSSEAGTIRFLFDHFADVSQELKQFGRVSLADRVMLYGANKRLLAVYERKGERERVGAYLVSEREGAHYLPMDDPSISAEITYRRNNLAIGARNKAFPDIPLPPGVEAVYPAEIPAAIAIDFFREGQQIGIRMAAPILRRGVKIGMLVGEVFYTQSMAEEYASLSKTDISFFAGNQFSLGTFTKQTALDAATLDTAIPCQSLLAAPRAMPIQSLAFGIHRYYQGQCVFQDRENVIGAITVNLSQAIEQKEIGKMLEAVFTISGIAIALSVGVVSWVIAPKFANPIMRLSQAAMRMAQGDLTLQIETGGNDELGTLSRSFVHMRGEIQRKIQELEQLNAALDQRVEERTAELLRQNYILDAFMETVPDRIVFKDRDGRITRANMAYARQMRLARPADAVGKTVFDFFPEDEARRRHAQEVEIMQTETPVFGVEEEREGIDGQEEWALITKMPLRNERGEMIGVFGISRDITPLKRGEEALRHAKEAAESANRAKSEFLANMSHELRTPLNVILGFAQIMARNPAHSAEDQEHLTIIRHSGEHLLTLINNVLDVSKIEAGRLSLNESAVDLFALLRDLEAMFSQKAAQKHLRLAFERAAALPRAVCVDAGKLRQVLINLLNNAVKFTQTGGVTLRVSRAEPDDPAACLLRFEVEDTGPGIAPDEMALLFQAFQQTQSGRQAQEGTGLGLAISQRFVRLLGGHISAQSEVGRGAAFAFTIPVKPADSREIADEMPVRRIIALETGQPRYRILIADDKPDNRMALVKLLTPIGFETAEASNGQEAIAVWTEFKPHLIWMDVRMPLMDGCEATRRMKATAQGRATVILALTASGVEDEQRRAMTAGCDGFLRKPFRETEIFDMMQKYLGVRYLCEEEAGLPSAACERLFSDILTPDALAALPPDAFAALRQAVDETDPARVSEIVAALAPQFAALGEALTALTKEFRFDILHTVFEETA